MKKVILTKGLSGCGKTSYARDLMSTSAIHYKNICKDDLRAMLDFGKHSKATEKFIIKVRDMLILETLNSGYSVIVSDTNLNPTHENHIRELVKGLATVEIKEFDIPIEECIERDLKRFNSVGEKVIRSQYNKYIKKPQARNVADQDPNLEHIVICDIDGTIALMTDRGPYDTSRYHTDVVNRPVEILLSECKLSVVYMSGRSEEFRKETEEWLAKYSPCNYKGLYMRPAGDSRRDDIVKEELYNQHIKGKYFVEYCIDDRDRVVQLWRRLGLTCLQCAEGDF